MFKGERLYLRAVEPEDIDLMYRVENDTQLWSCGNATVPYSRFALKNYIAESTCDIYADGRLRLTVMTNDGEAVGFIDLQNFDAMHRRAEVGVVILPEWQGMGYGSEAVELLAGYATRRLHLHVLYAIVSVENHNALKLFTQTKFKPSGTLTEWLYRGVSDYSDACLLIRVLP